MGKTAIDRMSADAGMLYMYICTSANVGGQTISEMIGPCTYTGE